VVCPVQWSLTTSVALVSATNLSDRAAAVMRVCRSAGLVVIRRSTEPGLDASLYSKTLTIWTSHCVVLRKSLRMNHYFIFAQFWCNKMNHWRKKSYDKCGENFVHNDTKLTSNWSNGRAIMKEKRRKCTWRCVVILSCGMNALSLEWCFPLITHERESCQIYNCMQTMQVVQLNGRGIWKSVIPTH
jgi:hypothetical protein